MKQRIMVVGCCGAGKSTFATQIARSLDLPLVHLDQCYWQPGWVEMEKEVWEEKVREMVAEDRWVIDGNYGSSLDIRLKRADMVVFMDTPRWVCLWRVVKRILTHYNRVRPDMPEGCRERFDWEFLKYVYFFHRVKRPGLLEKLKALPDHVPVVVIKRSGEGREWLQALIKEA